MTHKRADGRWQFSLKLPEELRDGVESIADERRWPRAGTVIYLLQDGLEQELADKDADRYTNIGDQPVTAATTRDDELVQDVESVANEDHGGSINAAARRIIWTAIHE